MSCCFPNPKQSVPKAFIPSYDVSEGISNYKSGQKFFQRSENSSSSKPGDLNSAAKEIEGQEENALRQASVLTR